MHVKCKHYLAHSSPPCKQCWPSDQSHEYIFSSAKVLQTDKRREPVKHNQKYLKQLKRVKKIACNFNSHDTTDSALFNTAYLTPLLTLDILFVSTQTI